MGTVTWQDALAGARELARRCAKVSAVPRPAEGRLHGWALPLYVLAAESGCPVTEIPPAWLRYRLADHDRYLLWMCSRLQGMGHRVRPPLDLTVPPSLQGRLATEEDRARTSQDVVDDPVALAWWSHTTISPGGDTELSDGTSLRDPASSEVSPDRHRMIAALDDALVLDRGGWPRHARVRTQGIPPYASSTGRTAAEAGIASDRAIIDAPRWELDHDQHTLADGPPIGYWLRYRSLRTGLADTEPVGPVGAEHLHLDLDPVHTHTEPARTPTDAAPTETEPMRPAGTTPTEGFDRELAALHTTADEAPPTPDERYRAAALARLWDLRDRELTQVGDSTPQRVAERITHDWQYPQPAAPPRARALRDRDRHQPNSPTRAPWCEPDQQLVTGEQRRWLLQWLPEVTQGWTTSRAREVLDDISSTSTLDEIRRTLALEGFVEVPDVHHNAGPPPQLAVTSPPAETTSSRTGDVDLILCHPDDGLIATIHANGPTPHSVHVYFNAAVLDDELFNTAISQGGLTWDTQQRLTNIRYGQFSFRPDRHDGSGSLRVRLAALRAFARPTLPWYHPVHFTYGPDSTPQDRFREVLRRLPRWIHDRFGPQLIESAR